jgi:hypothetical protein
MLQQVHTSKMTGKLIELQAISDDTPSNGFCYDRYIKAKAKNEKSR